jgi:WD40 repeat protein
MPIASLAGRTESVYAVAFSEVGRRLISAGGDNTIRNWNVEKIEFILRASPDTLAKLIGAQTRIRIDGYCLMLIDTRMPHSG